MFHCSAGKDRTGVVAAVLLGVMGVAASPAAMHGLIDALRFDYGGFDGYVDAIGVGSTREYLRHEMLT